MSLVCVVCVMSRHCQVPHACQMLPNLLVLLVCVSDQTVLLELSIPFASSANLTVLVALAVKCKGPAEFDSM